MGQSDWSPLAWELAQHAAFEETDGGGVKAWVTVSGATSVTGFGPTTTEAMRELARNLDKWARSDYAGI